MMITKYLVLRATINQAMSIVLLNDMYLRNVGRHNFPINVIHYITWRFGNGSFVLSQWLNILAHSMRYVRGECWYKVCVVNGYDIVGEWVNKKKRKKGKRKKKIEKTYACHRILKCLKCVAIYLHVSHNVREAGLSPLGLSTLGSAPFNNSHMMVSLRLLRHALCNGVSLSFVVFKLISTPACISASIILVRPHLAAWWRLVHPSRTSTKWASAPVANNFNASAVLPRRKEAITLS